MKCSSGVANLSAKNRNGMLGQARNRRQIIYSVAVAVFAVVALSVDLFGQTNGPGVTTKEEDGLLLAVGKIVLQERDDIECVTYVVDDSFREVRSVSDWLLNRLR